jgi:hypothetical protein
MPWRYIGLHAAVPDAKDEVYTTRKQNFPDSDNTDRKIGNRQGK